MSSQALGSRAHRLLRERRAIYAVLTWHAFDEAECCVSQKRIGALTGLSRQKVNRRCREMREDGQLAWKKERRPGARWDHNVYELLEPYTAPPGQQRRITRSAHRRSAYKISAHFSCGCPSCRPDRPREWRCGGPSPAERFARRYRE